jgi:S-(hydroxymethyl)glutathione dehydrogenase / alcohol dehydrogenase
MEISRMQRKSGSTGGWQHCNRETTEDMETIRAAVAQEPHATLVVESVRLRDLGPREVLVKIHATGLCHSDLNPLEGRSKIPIWPVVLGHEATGEIVQVGGMVRDLRVGDRIIAAGMRSCGRCWWCVRGQSILCERSREPMTPPMSRSDGTLIATYAGLGTFAEAMIIDEDAAIKIDTDLPPEQLALIGCGVTTGVCAVTNTARVEPGSTVAVIGVGGVGQSVVQGARISGASLIIAIDPVALKRDAAAVLGATHTIDPTDTDSVHAVQQLTGGRGVDYAFEVVGRPDTIGRAYEMVRRGGALTLVGAASPEIQAPWTVYDQMVNQKRVLGSLLGSAQVRRDFPRIVSLVEAGVIRLGPMVSSRLPLAEINSGLDAMISGEVLRAVVVN